MNQAQDFIYSLGFDLILSSQEKLSVRIRIFPSVILIRRGTIQGLFLFQICVTGSVSSKFYKSIYDDSVIKEYICLLA
jgi:hypothetical protein